MSENRVLENDGVEITDEGGETILMINDEENGIVFVKAGELEVCAC
jgi:hypothetical protein